MSKNDNDLNTSKDYFDSLLNKARTASEAYYHSADMLMTDSEYDNLVEEIESILELHPDWDDEGILSQVAAGTKSSYATITHTMPMLSLSKVKKIEEVAAFTERVQVPIIYEVKLDGLAVSISYDNGKLSKMVTRGDGYIGEDITSKATIISGIPLEIDFKSPIEIRGEIYMSDNDFYRTNESRVEEGSSAFLNPRNAVAGIIRSLELNYDVFLSFACYDIVGNIINNDSYVATLAEVEKWGITTAYGLTPKNEEYVSASEVLQGIEQVRPKLGFPIDGVVLKIDSFSLRNKLGSVSNAPKWACAYKYSADTATTILKDIEVAVGRTGQMSLRAVLEPVYVAGTTITYATLHNPKFVKDADIRIGDTVYVYRAGDVIPRVDAVDKSKRPAQSIAWEAPEACIKCDKPWDKTSLLWRCDSPSCTFLGRLEYALSRDALDVEGASIAVAESLVSSGRVKSIADIYRIDENALANLELSKGRILGAKNAKKIYSEIQRSKTLPNDKIFVALGLRTLGRTLSRRILPFFPTLSDLANATEEKLSKIEGIGKEKSNIIFSEISENKKLIKDLISLGVGETKTVAPARDNLPLTGEIVVISGSVPGYTREEAQSLVEELGGKSSSSISTKTTILVSGEGSGSKYDKAVSLGTKIWTPQQLLDLV